MNLTIDYRNSTGTNSARIYRMSRLAFAKHFAIAGQGYSPRPQKLMRTLGMFLHYSYYLQKNEFYNDYFSPPPTHLSDPTEKGQFSNLAGKAIADFLSKKIDNSIFTVNYEAALRLLGRPIRGGRPDLIAFTNSQMFAIEVKGYSSAYSRDMSVHKLQSQSGGIPVHYTVACVSYNLYNNVKCKYYDPINEKVDYDSYMLQSLTKNYYSGLAEFINEKNFVINERQIGGEFFFEVDILESLHLDDKGIFEYVIPEIFDLYKPKLILPTNIKQLSETGINNKLFRPFSLEEENKNVYIDNDRIGISVETNGW